MYFKWDLFRRHIKKWVYVAKNGFKRLFLCMGKTHKYTNVRVSDFNMPPEVPAGA